MQPSSLSSWLAAGWLQGITGIPQFCRLSAELAFGKDSPALAEGRLVTVQGLSGTGSLRVRERPWESLPVCWNYCLYVWELLTICVESLPVWGGYRDLGCGFMVISCVPKEKVEVVF